MKPLSEQNPAITYTFNILNVMRLRDHLMWLDKENTSPEVGFNMYHFFAYSNLYSYKEWDKTKHNCGTTACMAGHVILLSRGEKRIEKMWALTTEQIVLEAAAWLGISKEQACNLFYGDFVDYSFRRCALIDVTLNMAIAALDYMIEYGEIPFQKIRQT